MYRFDAKRAVDPKFVGLALHLAPQLGFEQRADANETALFARQLEYIFAETYQTLFPEYKARTWFPVDSSVPSGAETFTYYLYTGVGVAKLIANYADDLPNVSVYAEATTGYAKSIGDGYSYSLQDIRRAQMANAPLDSMLATAARQAIEAKIDDLAAFGDATANLPGALNNTNIPTTSGLTGGWGAASADAILADMNAVANKVVTQSKGIHRPNTMLMPISSYLIASQKRMSTQSDTTVLDFFLKTNPYITSVEQWYKMELADAGLDGPRIMAFERSPRTLSLVVSQEFEQLPPQAKNLAFWVPCHARVGGVKTVYPLAAAYGDIQ